MPNRLRHARALAAAALLLMGCGQRMGKSGHLRPQDASPIPGQGLLGREPIPGTIARGALHADSAYSEGLDANGRPIAKMPLPITRALLERGRERFGIYCAPCHGYAGYGDGMIVQRGFLAPPSYHQDRLRLAPDGHFFNVITHGYGAMYSYADRVPVADRWAIVAYIRALQLSQRVPASSLPPAERAKLEKEAP